MDPEILTQIGAMIDEKLSAHSAAFDAKLAAITAKSAESDAKIEETAKMSALAADKAALAAVKEFAKTLGQPAGSAAAPSSPPPPPAPAKRFEELVREHNEYAKSKSKAIADTIKVNGPAYQDYLTRLQTKGEIILF
jgi:hypothetical protein